MSTAKRPHYSYEDYLTTLDMSEVKLEFCDGVIYAMAGGTIQHAQLAAAVTRLLGQSLLGRCTAFSSDLKVRVESSNLTTFPDVSVVCGDPRMAEIDRHALVNPSLLVEVTSRSTEDYDRGDKLSHYKQIPSLRAVVFVSHRERLVTVVERTASGWSERDARAGESVAIGDPSLSFAVDDVYAGVSLEST